MFTLKIIHVKFFHAVEFSRFRSICEFFLNGWLQYGKFLVISLQPSIGRAKVSLAVYSGRSDIYLGGYGLARTLIACLIFAVGLDCEIIFNSKNFPIHGSGECSLASY